MNSFSCHRETASITAVLNKKFSCCCDSRSHCVRIATDRCLE